MAKKPISDNNSTTNTGEQNPQPAQNAPVSAVVPEATTIAPAAEAVVQGNQNESTHTTAEVNPNEIAEINDNGVKQGDEVVIANHETVVNDLKTGDGEQLPGSELEQVKNEIEFNEEIIAELMAPYLEHYPEEKTFYITTDFNVFLSAGKKDAETHQNAIAKDVDLVVFTVS